MDKIHNVCNYIFNFGIKSFWKYMVDSQKKYISDCFYKKIING